MLDIAEAMDAPKDDVIPLMSLPAGCVSGEFVYLYPPGIPILAPGELCERKEMSGNAVSDLVRHRIADLQK